VKQLAVAVQPKHRWRLRLVLHTPLLSATAVRKTLLVVTVLSLVPTSQRLQAQAAAKAEQAATTVRAAVQVAAAVRSPQRQVVLRLHRRKVKQVAAQQRVRLVVLVLVVVVVLVLSGQTL
jgi:hypothetical protein